MLYLHYYYDNFIKGPQYSSSIASKFNYAKVASEYLGPDGKMAQQYSERMSSMVSYNGEAIKNYEELLDFFADPDSSSAKAQMENFEPIKSDFKPVAALNEAKSITSESARSEAEKIAETVQIFQSSLTSAIDGILQQLGSKATAGEYCSEVVRAYAEKRGLGGTESGSARRQVIISSVISRKGLIDLGDIAGEGVGTQNKSLQTSLRKAALLADSIADFGTESGSAALAESGDSDKVLLTIANKLRGLFGNINRSGAALGWAVAEKNAEAVIVKELDGKVDSLIRSGAGSQGGGGIGYSVEVDKEDIPDSEKQEVHGSITKSGTTVSYDYNGVHVSYDVFLKSSTIQTRANFQSINLVSNADFMNCYTKYCGGGEAAMAYLYNVAAGHSLYTRNSDIAATWNELINTVVLTNYVDFLAGIGKETGRNPNNLYLVFNGEMIPIKDIINHLQLDSISGKLNNNLGDRFKFVELSIFKDEAFFGGSIENAKWARSNEATAAMSKLFSQAKFSISLNSLPLK